ncbi:MAG TPA: HDOD domain-containing protein [Desulfonatronum sp.]|nr:HDOD domain-containing protein [Desulfonatronum sp.]
MFFTKGQHFLKTLPDLRADLPFSPEVFQLLFSIDQERSKASMEALGRVMERDQGLAVRVLHMANSVYYGLQSQVSSVMRAVLVLGLKEIRKLLLLMSVRQLENKLPPNCFDLNAYWQHQVEVAHVAQALARHSGIEDPEEIFTCGLLHDLGKLIIVIHHPKHWQGIQNLAADKNIPVHQAEDVYWGLDHALIGALTLKYWFLPTSLTEPINWHHAPDLAQEHAMQARVLRLANGLMHMPSEAAQTPVYVGWEQDLKHLRLAPQIPFALAREVLRDEKPAAFLHGMGIPSTRSPLASKLHA